jgi:metal-responsive CopG/Arc/MetJ family transcriptional regulator
MRKSKIINMSLDEDLYKQVDYLAQKRRISRSQILKESLRSYLEEVNRWEEIRRWGEITSRKYAIATEEDVERIREEFEQESKI